MIDIKLFLVGYHSKVKQQRECVFRCPRNVMKSSTCAGSESLGEMQRACNGKRTCTITARNDRFGDPCRGTWKYVEVIYTCRTSPRITVDLCENARQRISCQRNEVIRVVTGFYGRKEKQTLVFFYLFVIF